MVWAASKTIKQFKKDYLDKVNLSLGLLILMMEPFTKDLQKMDKSLVKEYFKDLMDFTIQVILDMINLMEMEKFTILINPLLKDILKMELNMEKDV